MTDSPITLISGGNAGLGLATAKRLTKEHNHHVIIGSRNAEAGAEVAAELQAEGHSASTVQLDLESDASIAAAAKTIEEKFGRLDALINNAGVLLDTTDPPLPIRTLYTRTFSVNVFGTACLTEAVEPLLRKSSNPVIVFVSSRMGSLVLSTDSSTLWYKIDYTAYDASKAAVAMLAINWNRRLEDIGARVNVVCPGLVKTNLAGGVGAVQYGVEPYEGAKRVVELATLGKDGPTKTWSATDGDIPW
ncbi:carbonyl reductase [Amniculicola lignicola CBS 123094]|uniref:Carbonyl reductase n=1 Tax=Amniculicola lignicola CBS 123094 TaxID=1392246 RepID=A0A6A5WST2_9PLEO|nr:carbonyl reductase [Amniculicola lignicola CBS 123094]